MPWYAIALIVYIVLDRLYTVAVCGDGKTIDITLGFAAVSLITGALFIWAVVALATGIC